MVAEENLKKVIENIVRNREIVDIHTHLYAPEFYNLLLFGIDEILTYHYLIAEFFTYERNIPPEKFFKFSKQKQANLIWQKLFVENSPVSESTIGVVTILRKLGIDFENKDLDSIRQKFIVDDKIEQYIERILRIANIRYIVTTNNPFDEEERRVWLSLNKSIERDKFKTALRIDELFFLPDRAFEIMKLDGFNVDKELDKISINRVKDFLRYWIDKIKPLYLMVSVPPKYIYPGNKYEYDVFEKIVVPILREYNIPIAMMFGAEKQVNNEILLAGDAVKKSDITSIIELVKNHKDIKFLMTFLSRENIHETTVLARKFGNIKVFGCWWFTNIPYLIKEITSIRIELLGLNFIPQHSDARVLEHLIYKWDHFKRILIELMFEKYSRLIELGWSLSEDEIKRDIDNLLYKRFEEFLNE